MLSLHQCTSLRMSFTLCESKASHVIVAVWCSCSQLQPSTSALVSQGSYLQRHTSSLILKMSQDTATPPLPAVAHMVRLMPLLLYCQNVPLVMSIYATYFSMSCCYAGDSPHDCCMPGLCCIVRSHQLHYVLMHMLGSLVECLASH